MSLGPSYSYADELKAPSEIGINRDGSFDGIMRAVGGINYYVDAIGFGEATMMAKSNGLNQKPLGIQYFMKTGGECSNGADMYEYINTVPPGITGSRIGREIRNSMGVDMRGMAPGIISDAAGALNPMPLFTAITSGGYAQCKKITLPVGDLNGNVRSTFDSNNVWITDPYKVVGGVPKQTRWVLDKYVSQEEFDAAEKTEKAGILPLTEGFANRSDTVLAGVLLALLLGTIVATVAVKK